jgi:hypothetical protein
MSDDHLNEMIESSSTDDTITATIPSLYATPNAFPPSNAPSLMMSPRRQSSNDSVMSLDDNIEHNSVMLDDNLEGVLPRLFGLEDNTYAQTDELAGVTFGPFQPTTFTHEEQQAIDEAAAESIDELPSISSDLDGAQLSTFQALQLPPISANDAIDRFVLQKLSPNEAVFASELKTLTNHSQRPLIYLKRQYQPRCYDFVALPKLPDILQNIPTDPAVRLNYLKHHCIGVDPNGYRVNVQMNSNHGQVVHHEGQYLAKSGFTPFEQLLTGKLDLTAYATSAENHYNAEVHRQRQELLPRFIQWKKAQFHYEWAVFCAATKHCWPYWPYLTEDHSFDKIVDPALVLSLRTLTPDQVFNHVPTPFRPITVRRRDSKKTASSSIDTVANTPP